MIGLDTNILARYYVENTDNNNEKTILQRKLAKGIIESRRPLFVAKTVIIELEWILRGVYKFPVSAVISVFEHLCGLSHITIEDKNVIVHAIEFTRAGIEFTDALHLASSYHCKKLLSFDKKFSNKFSSNGFTPITEAPQ